MLATVGWRGCVGEDGGLVAVEAMAVGRGVGGLFEGCFIFIFIFNIGLQMRRDDGIMIFFSSYDNAGRGYGSSVENLRWNAQASSTELFYFAEGWVRLVQEGQESFDTLPTAKYILFLLQAETIRLEWFLFIFHMLRQRFVFFSLFLSNILEAFVRLPCNNNLK